MHFEGGSMFNQQDLNTIGLHFDKSIYFTLTWSCASRQQDTVLSGWKLQLNNLALQGLIEENIIENRFWFILDHYICNCWQISKPIN